MKINKFLFALIIIIFFSSCNMENKKKTHITEVRNPVEKSVKKKQLRHIVLFKFKENTTQDKIVIVEQAFASLPGKIPEIRDFEWGINNSLEEASKGFTHSFILTFDSEKDLENYLPHSDHKDFVKILTPILEDVLVVDYWTNE